MMQEPNILFSGPYITDEYLKVRRQLMLQLQMRVLTATHETIMEEDMNPYKSEWFYDSPTREEIQRAERAKFLESIRRKQTRSRF